MKVTKYFGLTAVSLSFGFCVLKGEARSKRVEREVKIQGITGPYFCLMNCATVPGVAMGGAYYLENGNARTQILGGGRRNMKLATIR